MQFAFGREDKALEHRETKGVVAANPVLAFGREHQQRVETLAFKGLRGAGLAGGVFGLIKVHCQSNLKRAIRKKKLQRLKA